MIRDTSSMDQPLDSGTSRPWLVPALVAALVLCALLFAAVFFRPWLARWTSAEQSIARDQLRFATVERGDLVHEVAVQGRVVAASRPTLYSPSAGTVSLRVREGEGVHAGDVLAELVSPEIESQLLQERATLEALESDLQRLELSVRQRRLANLQDVERLTVREAAARREVLRSETLAEAGLINEIQLEAARDDLTVVGLELAQARQNVGLEQEMLGFELDDARRRVDRQALVVAEAERRVDELAIRAPFDGLVATLAVEDRDAVVRGQAVLGVVDLTDLEVEVAIPEAYADDLAPGLEAVLRIDGAEHAGRLVRVAPEVRSSQVEGRVAFAGGAPSGLRQNQRVSARLVLDRRTDVLKVRRGPFVESLGGRRAWVVDDGLARLLPIEIGVTSVTEVEIVGGLEPADEIVLSDLSRVGGAETLLLRD